VPLPQRPVVLFACSSGAGRAAAARALADHQAAGAIDARCAGTTDEPPPEPVLRCVAEALSERGVAVPDAGPVRLSTEAVLASDVLVTLGCSDACTVLPARRYEDWHVPDPEHLDAEGVRRLLDDLDERVRQLLISLGAVVSHDDPPA
jgi:arsenate reductase (thioredoxin)